MTEYTKTTTTTSNGSTYEILIHHNWLNGTVTCMDDGRSYAFAADDAETIDEAIAEAADWCEWQSVHGDEHILHEVVPEPKVLTGFTVEYDGYIVNGEQFKTLAEADAYIVEKGLTLPDDEREAFEIHEWPDGTWLGIRCYEPEDIEPAFELADFEVVSKEDILNMDCNYNIEGERAYRLLRGTDSCIISFAQGEWCAEYIHWYYDANGEKVEDYLEDFFGDAPYKVCDKASAYAVKVAELIKAEGRD